MALVLKDRVRETTTTAGTGTITLAGAVTGFQSFAIIGNGNTTYYCISGQGTNEWEVGIGTYTSSGTTLARTTVLANSSATQPSALNFSAGTKDVFVTYPAEKSVNLDASDNVSALGTVASGTWQATTVGVGYGGTGQTSYTDGQLLIGNSTGNTLTKSTLTAGSGISITNGGGSITIANTSTGATITNDTSTSSNVYPVFAGSTTGSLSTAYTSNAKLLYKPSTGEFQSSALIANNGFLLTNTTVATSYTVASGTNALSVGPMSIGSGITVTVSSGQRWVVI